MIIDQLQIHWVWFALLAMFFAGMAPVLAKFGLKNTSDAVGAAIALLALVFFAWSGRFAARTIVSMTGYGVRNILLLLLGGILIGIAVLCFTSALNQSTVHETVPFQTFVTVLTLLYGILVLKTGFTTMVFIGMVLIVVGIVCLTVGSSHRGGLGRAFLFVVLAALVQILDAWMPVSIDSSLVYPIRITIACIFAWLVVLFSKGSKEWKRITLYSALMMLLAGCSYCFAAIAYERALIAGDTGVVTTLYSVSLLAAVLLAVLLLKENVGRKGLIGLLCIMIGIFVL